MRRERGTGSVCIKKGSPCFWLRYNHEGKRVEQSSGIRHEGGDKARTAALAMLRAKTKTTDTPAYIAPKATRLTFEALRQLIVDDYMKKGRKSARRLKQPGGISADILRLTGPSRSPQTASRSTKQRDLLRGPSGPPSMRNWLHCAARSNWLSGCLASR